MWSLAEARGADRDLDVVADLDLALEAYLDLEDGR